MNSQPKRKMLRYLVGITSTFLGGIIAHQFVGKETVVKPVAFDELDKVSYDIVERSILLKNADLNMDRMKRQICDVMLEKYKLDVSI